MTHVERQGGGLRSGAAGGLLAMAALCMCLWVTGCQSHAIRGKVISGDSASVQVVSENDERLELVGVNQASIRFTADPQSLGRKEIGSTVSHGEGRFELPTNLFGAGVLEYDLGVLARAAGHEATTGVVPMPQANQRLLIVLKPGTDTYQPPHDPKSDLERYGW